MRTKRGWLGFVNDIPLTRKFALIYLLCVLLPILSINVLFYRQVSESVQARQENNLHMTLDRASKKAMDMILGGVALSHSVATDRILYEELDRDYTDLVDFYESNSSVLGNKMKPFLSAYTEVENISVYTENPTIASGGNFFVLDDVVKRSPWYREASNSSSAVNVLVYTDTNPINVSATKEYFSVIRKLNEYPMYGQYAKYLKIDLKVSRLDEILSQERQYLALQVLDPQGRVLFPSDSYLDADSAPAQSEDEKLRFESRIGSASYIAGWKMVGTADANLFQEAVQSSQRYIWMLAAFSTLLPTSLIFVIFRSYSYRIKRLSRHMDKANHEKFDLIQIPEGKDEIGGLIRSFNRMASTIESLINDVYKLEIQQKDMQLEQVRAELKLLQSQMNPHFLFNTLNALLVVSAKNGYNEVTDIIKNLAMLLRRMLSWSDDNVTLQDELHFTEMYLKIEKFRFTDRFDYALEIEEGALSCMVPKMSIQTLVENACKHGLQSVKGHRHIRVSAAKTGAFMTISVEDNGIGIDPKRLDQIRGTMSGNLEKDENIGLRNVYKRLQLHYGERVDLTIESEEDRGTRIRFRIPAYPTEEGGQSRVFGTAGG